MQQMKTLFRAEPPLTAPEPQEYGRAEPPLRKQAMHSEHIPVTPARVIPDTSGHDVPDRVAKEAAASLKPRKPLVENIEDYRKKPQPKTRLFGRKRDEQGRVAKPWRLFAKTRNIHERSDKVPPYVLSADMQDDTEPKTEARDRLGFRLGVFRRPRKTTSKDPAPSRLNYRLQRLWLTPLYRSLLRTGIPAFVVVFGVGTYLADDTRREVLVGQAESVIRSVQERPEFMVKMMLIEGASPELASEIRSGMPLRFPLSSFDLDLEDLRQQVVAINAVDTADLRIKPGGILELKVTERAPSLVWRSHEGLTLLDDTGHPVIRISSRLERPDLPLISGAGADRAADEAIKLIQAVEPVSARLRGLVRVGERRWTVVLDRGQRILLPEHGAVEALQRVMALAIAEDMLARDVSVIDMRYSARPTLRLSEDARRQFRQPQKQLETGASSG